MKNIFLDIGAHNGESLEIAVSKKYNFHRIIAVEPSTHCNQYLKKYKDKRIEIHKIGLGDANKTLNLFGSGSVGASIFLEKKPYWSTSETITIHKFSEWYARNIDKGSHVYIKINCEGSEIEIIPELELVDTSTIVSILVSFDIEKIPSLRQEKKHLIEILNNRLEIDFVERTKKLEVKEWLESMDEIKNKRNLLDYIESILRPGIPITRNLRRIMRPVIPEKLWVFLALSLGPNRKR